MLQIRSQRPLPISGFQSIFDLKIVAEYPKKMVVKKLEV